MCAVEQGQPDDARPHLDTALAVAPTDPEVLLVAFHHALAVDAVPHAEAIADTLAQALPDTGLYEECAARILMMKGDF